MPDPSPQTDEPAPQPAQPASAQPGSSPDAEGGEAGRLIRRLHAARRRGDAASAAAAWSELLVAELERVRGIVRGYRHQALPGGRIPHGEVDDVVSAVFIRLHKASDSLRGESVGELRAFLRTACSYACADFLRAHVTADRRAAGSLDAGADEPGGASPAALAQALKDRDAAEQEALQATATVHEALAEVDEDKRMVLVLQAEGLGTEEIQERLGISRDVVYQRRRRGLGQMRDAIRERDEEDGLR